jgi:2-keto-4-pentenoate hydratase
VNVAVCAPIPSASDKWPPWASRYDSQVSSSGAQLLSEARINQVRLAALPTGVCPNTLGEAYECQAELVARLLQHYGGEVAGYKIACTNVTAQQQLHVTAPFSGNLMSSFCWESPAQVDGSQFFMRVVEAEFGFLMAQDLGSGSTSEEIAGAIEGVIPSIEIVDSRFDDWTTIGALSLIADNACHAAWVHGPLLREWRGLDLAAQAVRVIVNGRLVREGSGRAVLGHPLNALQWLVKSLHGRGLSLRAGQYITTGVTTEVYFAERGDRILADFGAAGSAAVQFV